MGQVVHDTMFSGMADDNFLVRRLRTLHVQTAVGVIVADRSIGNAADGLTFGRKLGTCRRCVAIQTGLAGETRSAGTRPPR